MYCHTHAQYLKVPETPGNRIRASCRGMGPVQRPPPPHTPPQKGPGLGSDALLPPPEFLMIPLALHRTNSLFKKSALQRYHLYTAKCVHGKCTVE